MYCVLLLLLLLSVHGQIQVRYGAYGSYMSGVPLPAHPTWNPKSLSQLALERKLAMSASDLVDLWTLCDPYIMAAAGITGPNAGNDTASVRSTANYIRLLSRLAAGMTAAVNAAHASREERERLELERFDSAFLLEQLEKNMNRSCFGEFVWPRFAVDVANLAIKQRLRLQPTWTVWQRAVAFRTALLLPPGLVYDTDTSAKLHLDLHLDFMQSSPDNLGNTFMLLPDYAELTASRLLQISQHHSSIVVEWIARVMTVRRHLSRVLCKTMDILNSTVHLHRLIKALPEAAACRLLQTILSDSCFTNNDLYDGVMSGTEYLLHAPRPQNALASPWETECGTGAGQTRGVRLWPHRHVLQVHADLDISIFRVHEGIVDEVKVREREGLRTVEYAVGDFFVIPKKVQVGKETVREAERMAAVAAGPEEHVLQLAAMLPECHVMVILLAP